MQTVKTTNEHYGFYGTINLYNNTMAEAAWNTAISQLEAATGHYREDIGAWLDTRIGRHFADQVTSQIKMGADMETAIAATIEKWNKFKQNRHHRSNGTPASATYLQADIAMVSMDLEA